MNNDPIRKIVTVISNRQQVQAIGPVEAAAALITTAVSQASGNLPLRQRPTRLQLIDLAANLQKVLEQVPVNIEWRRGDPFNGPTHVARFVSKDMEGTPLADAAKAAGVDPRLLPSNFSIVMDHTFNDVLSSVGHWSRAYGFSVTDSASVVGTGIS